jgi:regulator of replication initiation timing
MADSILSLKLANSQLKKEVRALKSEIGKLQTKNAKLETENISARHRIKVLEKLKVSPERKPDSDFETVRKLAFILRSADMHIVTSSGEKILPDTIKPNGNKNS